jgi:hypothetical protein
MPQQLLHMYFLRIIDGSRTSPTSLTNNNGEDITPCSNYTLPAYAFRLSFMRQHVVIHRHTIFCHLLARYYYHTSSGITCVTAYISKYLITQLKLLKPYSLTYEPSTNHTIALHCPKWLPRAMFAYYCHL